MAVPICAASPAGSCGIFADKRTLAGQAIQRDAADGLRIIFCSMILFLHPVR